MKPRAAIFDIDGTLADNSHRLHLVDHTNYTATPPQNWDEFKRLASDDPPVADIVELARTLHTAGFAIVCCTGRSQDQYTQTQEWLKKWGIPCDALYMRTNGDYREDVVVKRELLAQIRKKFKPWIVVDDRQSVVDMWRAEGLTCLQCAPGHF